jgi:hypothetical protein
VLLGKRINELVSTLTLWARAIGLTNRANRKTLRIMGLLTYFKFFFGRTVTTSTGDMPVKDQKT